MLKKTLMPESYLLNYARLSSDINRLTELKKTLEIRKISITDTYRQGETVTELVELETRLNKLTDSIYQLLEKSEAVLINAEKELSKKDKYIAYNLKA